MKTLLHLLSFVVLTVALFLLAGCGTSSMFSPGTGAKYQYTFRMVRPAEDRNLIYRDDSLIVQFRFDEAAVRFQLQNLAHQNLGLQWDKAALGVNGRFYPVRHAGNLYGDSADAAKSQLLPPFGFVRDLLIPRENISFDGRRWVEQDLLPTTDNDSKALRESILKSPGQTVTVLLPLTFGAVQKEYRFDFKIDTVRAIAWRDYKPMKRAPAPPNVARSSTTIDQLTAAVLTVGVLGFAAFLLTAKKSPPTE
jgi:hypothetical protein